MTAPAISQTLALEVADHFLPQLWDLTVRFGLPGQIARTLRLEWDGAIYHARTTDRRLREYEYGDGKRPPKAPVRKAMNRLQAQMQAELRRRSEELYQPLLEGVAF